MTWTLEKWNALFAWSAVAFAFIMSGGDPSPMFKKVYRRARRRQYLQNAPPDMIFGWIWTLVATMLVAGGVLFAINYETCDNAWYIAITVTSLAHFFFLGLWGRIFWRYGSPRGAFVDMFIVLGTGIATVVGMIVVALSSCLVEKTEAWVAVALWSLPLIWYVWALVINWQWMQIPRHKLIHMMRKD